MTGTRAHRVVAELTIRRILFATENGVSIFAAADQNGKSVRVLAASKVMGRPPGEGETWEVEGELRRHAEYGDRHLYPRIDGARDASQPRR